MAKKDSTEEKLKILQMIKDGGITPEDGVRLIDAIERADGEEQGPREKRDPALLKWLNIEVVAKRGEKVKSLPPIRIPYSLIKLFFRFIPRDTSLTGESTLDSVMTDLENGKPLEFLDSNEGRCIRITTE